MNIWSEFEENGLKTLPCRLHTRKNAGGPLVATNVIKLVMKIVLEYGPMKI